MFQLPDGVEVQVLNATNRHPLEIEGDGRIGRIGNIGFRRVILEVILSNPEIVAVHVDGRNNVVPVEAITSPGVSSVSHERVVQIKFADTSPYVWHTEYPGNTIRLLGRDGLGVKAWQVALVSQEGDFFITCHVTHGGMAYRGEDGNAFAPVLHQWHGHEELIDAYFIGVELPSYDKYDGRDELTDIVLPTEARDPDKTGVVLFYNPARSFGGIKTMGGDIVRFHSRAIRRMDESRLRYLDRGDIVRIGKVAEPVQTKARGTAFELEAGWVRLES